MEGLMAWFKDAAAGLTFVAFLASSYVLTAAAHAVIG
jgi:hypothetical protein